MATCGSTDTKSGAPCQRGANCPYHRGPGRPTKYRPRYCERVVELGRQGDGVAEIADALGVTKQTLHNWQAEYHAFLDAMTRARDAAEAWWARQGKAGIWERDFNAGAYRLQVMNRFPSSWRDRKQLEHSGPEGGPIKVDVDDARQKLADELTRIAERRRAASGAGRANGR